MFNRQQRELTARVRSAKEQRLEELEVQAAKYGVGVPPHIATEIEDLRAELDVVSVLDRKPIDRALREVLAQTDYADLIGKFMADHSRRIRSLEDQLTKLEEYLVESRNVVRQWFEAREAQLREDQKAQQEDRRTREERQHKLDLALGALAVGLAFTIGLSAVLLIIALNR